MTIKKEQKRRLYILKYLLDGREHLQPSLFSSLNSSKEFDGEISEATLSGVLGNLDKEKIITRNPIKKEGKGANPNVIIINKDYETLVKLISEFSSPDIGVLADSFKSHFILSVYAQKLINKDCLLKIESNICDLVKAKISVKDFKFSIEECDIILNILQSSPSALYYATNNYEVLEKILEDFRTYESILDDLDEQGINIIKKKFILNLQLKLGDDIIIGIANLKKTVEYKISIKFTDINPRSKRLEQNIERNKVESIFTTNIGDG
jgi:hypothetical protein